MSSWTLRSTPPANSSTIITQSTKAISSFAKKVKVLAFSFCIADCHQRDAQNCSLEWDSRVQGYWVAQAWQNWQAGASCSSWKQRSESANLQNRFLCRSSKDKRSQWPDCVLLLGTGPQMPCILLSQPPLPGLFGSIQIKPIWYCNENTYHSNFLSMHRLRLWISYPSCLFFEGMWRVYLALA